jgi:hypothetical protein
MKTKFILAGLAGGVINFLLGWLVYGLLMMKFFESNTMHYEGLAKAMPDLWLLILSCLAVGFFMVFVFSRWANIATWKGGLIGGLIIGLFMSLIYDLSFLSMYNLYNATATIVDIILAGITYGITGAGVGWVLGAMGKKQ